MGDWDLTVMVRDSRLPADEVAFTTTSSGGHQGLTCPLVRSAQARPIERLFDPVRLLGPSGRSVWEGRVGTLPRTVDNRVAQTSLQAVGLASIMEDRQDARLLGIDRDAGAWTNAPTARQLALYALPLKPLGTFETAEGGLRGTIEATPWTTFAGRPLVESWYDGGPLRVSRVIANFTKRGQTVGNVAYSAQLAGLLADGVTGAGGYSPNYGTTAADSQNVDWSPASPRPTALTLTFHATAASGGTANEIQDVLFAGIAVIGDHTIPVVGTTALNAGLKASDCLRWLIATYCPGLTAGDVADTGVVLQHVAYKDPQTVGQIFSALNANHAWAWGVWEGGRVDYNPFGAGRSRTWLVRSTDPGVRLSQEGDDAANMWANIVVSYTTPDGKPRTVGGPGTLADTTDPALSVTDPEHPAYKAGVTRTYVFSLDTPTIMETAVSIGRIVLAQLNAARRAGSVTVSGMVQDSRGRLEPCYMIRGGDQVIVTDVSDATPRQAVATNYTHATRSCDVTIDNTLQTVEAIVSHLGGRSVGVG